jgi:hypothetical protein
MSATQARVEHQHPSRGWVYPARIVPRWRFGLVWAILVAVVGGPASWTPAATVPSVLIKGVPHVVQKPDFCGEACVAAYLAKLGQKLDQDDVFNASGLDPVLGRGCYTRDLVAAVRTLGFRPGNVWYPTTTAGLSDALRAQWRAIYDDLAVGVPSILCMHYDNRPNTSEHFRLILGYDAGRDEIVYHEPAEAAGAYRRMPRATLYELWPLRHEGGATLIRLRLAREAADTPPVIRHHARGAFTAADYAQHIMKLKRKVPAKGFTLVVSPPFVVIGDDSAEEVRRRADGTVKWAVDRLKSMYFSKDPHDILDIWLFQDDDSYRTHCREIFGETPDTPYGFFSPQHRALIMNISTGGGTLVHEIVHPFVAANFPECPAWFNEGLGSLYEQTGEENGRIHGYPNWRLPGLQKAVRAGRVPSFHTLCSTTTDEFYSHDKGTNYAQARYLCYYLQQRDLLQKYYRQFHRDCHADPTGYETLKSVLGEDDMKAFQKRWEEYVLKLHR